MPAFPNAQRVLRGAVSSRTAPCAAVEVGTRTNAIWREAVGRLTYDEAAPAASSESVFDLASLTKVLATTALAMRLVDDRRLDLAAPVAGLLPSWRGRDRDAVRVLDLLAHSSGLPAHAPLHRSCEGRADFERAIGSEPLGYAPGTGSLYSDLGFMLLGFILEDAAGESLDRQFDRLCIALQRDIPRADKGSGAPFEIRYRPPSQWRVRIAPTRPQPADVLVADDENARALSGIAGHAGLFGTVEAVGAMARATLNAALGARDQPALASHETASRFISKAGIPGSSRALGWDTMRSTSSCGTHMSDRAFGHTGFTGTSLWIDPAAGIYVVLLTNRVYPAAGSADRITACRRAMHDAVMTDWVLSNRPA